MYVTNKALNLFFFFPFVELIVLVN